MKSLFKVTFILLLLILMMPLMNDVEEYDCRSYGVKDGSPSAPKREYPHTHIFEKAFPNLKVYNEILNKSINFIVFEKIVELKSQDVDLILSSKTKNISFKNLQRIKDKDLKRLMKLNIHWFSRRIDSLNLSYDNFDRKDSILILGDLRTLRIAKQAMTLESSLILDGFKELTDSQAKILTRYKGIYLQLGGITKLPDKQLKILSFFQGAELCMANLNEVDQKKYQEYRKQYVRFIVPETKQTPPDTTSDCIEENCDYLQFFWIP